MGINNKRQVIVVVESMPTGNLLPPQVLYQGKSVMCHPTGVPFPNNCQSCWSNHDTIKRYMLELS